MADASVLPKIRVDPQPLERQDTGGSARKTGKEVPPLTNGKLASKLRSPGGKEPNESVQNGASGGMNGGPRRSGEAESAPIDPLSQHILKRTNTSNLQRYRPQTAENTSQPPLSPNDTNADTKGDAVRDTNNGASKADKKKGVSFLSRFMGGTKKKAPFNGTEDNGSEFGDYRPEGMDATLFTHNVDNLGFNPKHPTPPAYIKVRTKFKKEKEFDRLFLAQELRSRTAKGEGANPAPQSGSAASHNPVWASEFSKDGKFLAAGGQDRVVRVWAVLSTAEERRAHEEAERERKASGGESTHLSAPVFQQKPYREYVGHTSTILDLSWSKNNFLLSSSMDKTVRLWHLSRNENLCTFKHSDFVPSIQFHPRDDRFFLAGSLDAKLRLWSIPDKSVAYWTQLPDMITSVSFTPDGKTCIAGTLGGLCIFYETEGLKHQSQIHVKSTRGQNAKGSKITGIQTKIWEKGGGNKGEVKILITSNDSRVRVYNMRDKSLEMKLRAHENAQSQIRATFADDTGHIICGSEDRKAYIWSTTTPEGEKRNQRPVEMFEAHGSITTCAIIAPLKTRQLLSASEDPIFDLCNPPPVTLVSREQSVHEGAGSKPPTEGGGRGSPLPTPADPTFTKVAESPAYLARCSHTNGNIIVTADYTGGIKVFRQDCAYTKRMRFDNWDASSVFSKRTTSKIGGIGRSASIISRGGRSRRDSTSTQPPNERIMSWRQELSHGSFDGGVATPRHSLASIVGTRSVSPRKRRSRISRMSSISKEGSVEGSKESSPRRGAVDVGEKGTGVEGRSRTNATTKTSRSRSTSPPTTPSSRSLQRTSSQTSNFDPVRPANLDRRISSSNPLNVYNGQSWAFWNASASRQAMKMRVLTSDESMDPDKQGGLRPGMAARGSMVSALSMEMSEPSVEEEEDGEGEGSKGEGNMGECERCGGKETKWRIRGLGGSQEKCMVCGVCGVERER